MEQVISGFVVSLLTEVCKRVPSIPLNAQSTNIIRAVSALLSILSQVGMVMVQSGGDLSAVNWGNVGIASLITYIYSIVSYHGVVKQS
jgi:hypothetical protein